MENRNKIRELYNHLFEPASGINETVKKEAKLSDTIAMLPKKVREYKHQAIKIAETLRNVNDNVKLTCYSIWDFLNKTIKYVKDETGKEQVRSTRRLWSDGVGDCDCLSFFTSSVLSVLRIPHKFRLASYDKVNGAFGHVYVVVPHAGEEIIIDRVMPEFNREQEYIKIKDINMDLEFLDGIDANLISQNGGMSIDARDLLSCQFPSADETVGSLKNLFSKTKEKVQNTANHIKEAAKKTTNVISKGVHVANRINPATTALRLGLLAGLKLNLFKVGESLRYAYLTDEEAKKRGINPKRFSRFKRVRERLEKIFFNAGGKPENMKEAILKGKGNSDKAVALAGYELSGIGFTNSSSVQEIIGSEIYADETPEKSLDGLGEVVTATVVTAASGILAAIAGVLKNIGPLFEKGEPGTDKELDALEQQAGENPSDYSTPSDDGSNERVSEPSGNESSQNTSNTNSSSGETQSTDSEKPPGDDKANFFTKAKDWIVENKKPLAITAAAVGLAITGFLLYRNMSNKKKEIAQKKEGSRAPGLHGVKHDHSGNNKKGGKKKESKSEKILRELRLSRLK